MFNIAAQITWIATHLRNAIGVFAAREARAHQVTWLGNQAYVPVTQPNQPPKLPDQIWLLLWNRLGRLSSRFQALHDRWRSNTLPPQRAPRPQTVQNPRETPPPVRLPSAHGWAGRRIPEAAPSAGQLEYLLQDPDTRALTEAAPQAGRLLRPLCRALGITQPDWLRLPRRPRRPGSSAPLPPSTLAPFASNPSSPSATPTPEDRPLPPYVRAAAKAWKRKFG